MPEKRLARTRRAYDYNYPTIREALKLLLAEDRRKAKL